MKAIISLLVFSAIISNKVTPTATSIDGTWLLCMTKIKGEEIQANGCPFVIFKKGNATIFWSKDKIVSSLRYKVEDKKLIVMDATPKCFVSKGEYIIQIKSDTQLSVISEDKTEYTLGRI